ncbi:MAG: hypothetical protein ACPGJE_00355 [Wenzhouxiangellaceae bacterium]
MLKKTLITIALLAGISGVLLYFFSTPYSDKQSAVHGDSLQSSAEGFDSNLESRSDEQAEDFVAATQSRDTIDEIAGQIEIDDQLRIMRRVSNAANANAYFEALSSLEQIDAEYAAEKRRHLDDLCSDMKLAADTEAIRNKRQAFCNGYLGSPRRHSRSVEELVDEMAISAEFRLQQDIKEHLEKARADGEATEVFTQLVLQSIFPEQIHVLMAQNVRSFMQDRMRLWRLGEEIQRERYPSADLLNAQTTALRLYQCAKFGGCGSSQYFAVIYCLINLLGRCESTATVEEMLYQTTAPADFNLANEILSKLLNY